MEQIEASKICKPLIPRFTFYDVNGKEFIKFLSVGIEVVKTWKRFMVLAIFNDFNQTTDFISTILEFTVNWSRP